MCRYCFCRLTFETALKTRGSPSLVFGHSMGNNVFRYFLEWLKLEIAPKKYIQWLDDHIQAYFAVGMSVLFKTFTFYSELSRGQWRTILYRHCAVHLISGSPFLGSVQIIEATFSGLPLGLPVSEVLLPSPFLSRNLMYELIYSLIYIWELESDFVPYIDFHYNLNN